MSLIWSGVSAMGVKLAAAALSYAMFVVLARWLGADVYGQYASVLSAGTFLGFVMLAGLQTEVLRKLPSLDGHDQDGKRYSFLKGAFRALAVSGLFVGIVGALVAAAFSLRSEQWAEMVLLSLALGAALASAEFLASLFRALGAVNIALIPRDVLWRALVLGVVLTLAALGIEGGLLSAALLTVTLLLVALGAQIFFGRGLYPLKGESAQPVPPVLTLLWDARWLAAAALASNILQPLAVVAVGIVLSYADTGLFFAAQKTATMLSVPLFAMNMIGAPQIARAAAAGDKVEVQRICTRIAVTATAGMAVGLAVVLGFSGSLLAVFNPAYRGEEAILVILSLGNVVYTVAGPTSSLMLMTGHEKRFVVISAAAQLIGILTVLIGGKLFGLVGAGCGEFAGLAIFSVVMWRWCSINLDINASFFSILRNMNR